MKVSTRLYAAVIPAVLGVLSVTALSCWAQHAQIASEYVIALAVLTAGASLIMVWRNARYVERLTSLNAEPTIAQPDAMRRTVEMERRQAEYATLIADTSAMAVKRVENVRMPLHILLNTELGQLNENQEEMLGAAETALEELSGQLHLVREIADADRGALRMVSEPVHIGDIVRGLEPMLHALAAKEGVKLVLDLEPVLPRAIGNTDRLRDAIRLTLSDDIRHAIPGVTITVATRSEQGAVVVTVDHGLHHSHGGDLMLAERLISAQGGTVSGDAGRTTISIPRWDAVRYPWSIT